MNRRHFLTAGGTTLAGAALAMDPPVPRSGVPVAQEPLEYDFGALEPHIDAATMELHFKLHHAEHATALQRALGTAQVKVASVSSLLKTMEHLTPGGQKAVLRLAQKVERVPDDVRLAILYNAGGHLNHAIFWRFMAPPGSVPAEPRGKLAAALQATFGGLDEFKKAFAQAAMSQFGSGWVWLSYRSDAGLFISTTSGHDNPLMQGIVPDAEWGRPILCLDLWEHAYYLKYQNRRADYVSAWWNVVNWPRIEQNYAIVTTTTA